MAIRLWFDLSYVGPGSGVSRVVRSLALALGNHRDCRVTFGALGSLIQAADAANFVGDHPGLGQADIAWGGLAQRLAAVRRRARQAVVASNGRSSAAARLWDKACGGVTRGLGALRPKCDARRLAEVDVLHVPFGALPGPTEPSGALRRFITVHDLIPLSSPHLVLPGEVAACHHRLASIRPDDWVICCSEFTRQALCRLTSAPAEQTFVIPWGADPTSFYPCHDAARRAAVRLKYGIGAAPYALCMASNHQPYKNIDFLVRVFERLASQARLRDLQLVVAGGWRGALNALESIHYVGYVDEADLAPLYSDALALVHPSLHEGFGLPALEAMQCGAPVIAGRNSSLPEVVGDGGPLLDLDSEQDWVDAIVALHDDPCLRERWAAAALRRAGEFSWPRCVAEHVAAYRVALANERGTANQQH